MVTIWSRIERLCSDSPPLPSPITSNLFSCSPICWVDRSDQISVAMAAGSIDHLTKTFINIQEYIPNSSLKMWFEEGKLVFFLSNLSPRNQRRKATSYNLTATAPSTDVTVSRTTETVDHLTSPGTQTRTKGKLQKRKCPTSSTEVVINSNSDELPDEVSSLE